MNFEQKTRATLGEQNRKATSPYKTNRPNVEIGGKF